MENQIEFLHKIPTLFFQVAANDTLLQSQTNPRTCSLNLLSAEESGGEINHGDNYKEKYCFEAPAMATLDLHHTGTTVLSIDQFYYSIT